MKNNITYNEFPKSLIKVNKLFVTDFQVGIQEASFNMTAINKKKITENILELCIYSLNGKKLSECCFLMKEKK